MVFIMQINLHYHIHRPIEAEKETTKKSSNILKKVRQLSYE